MFDTCNCAHQMINSKELSSEIEKENKFIKALFNISYQGKNSAERIKEILSFIQNSKNGPNYFIQLIDYFYLCRPQHLRLSMLFVKCVFFCFPETTEANKTFIKNQTEALKFILFPEECKQNPNAGTSQKDGKQENCHNEPFLLLQKDDDTSFSSFLQNHSEIDIQRPQIIKAKSKYYAILNWFSPYSITLSISLIDFCCFFGSLKCFKYLLLNKCYITEKTLKYSIAGGNQEIINILKEKGHSFEECLETSVEYHRYELTKWLNENYKCKPVSLPKCIEYYNIDAFLYFLDHGHPLDEIDQ